MAQSTYTKHDWQADEVISETNLDNIEQGIVKAHELVTSKVSLPAGGNGTNGQILVTAGDGTTRWENKPADGAKGPKGDKGDRGEAGAQGPAGAKGEKGDPGETRAKLNKIDNATTTDDAKTKLNDLLADLKAKGYMNNA